MKKLADWFYYAVMVVTIIAFVLAAYLVMTGPKHTQSAIENEIVSPYGNCSFCESYPAIEPGGCCEGCENRFRRHAEGIGE